MRHERLALVRETVDIDGNEYVECSFLHCKIQFGGTALPTLVSCSFDGCTWKLVGAAALTAEFLRGIHNDGGQTLVARLLAFGAEDAAPEGASRH